MTLHPQSAAFLAAVEQSDRPSWPEMPLEEARKVFDRLDVFGEAVEVDNVRDDVLAGVPVRIYHVNESQPRNVVVFFHGGGWVLGSIDSHDAVCRRLAKEADVSIVSVGYRQPPESMFPAAVEDCFTVCDVLAHDYDSFKVTDQMVLAGDSAGGNLAAAVSLMASRRGGPALCGQVLIYPVLDASMSTDSYRRFAADYGLTAEVMRWFWENYTGDVGSPARQSPLASLSVLNDVSEFPPTHIVLAEYDVLYDECRTFADKLIESDVPTTVTEFPGMLHGFYHFASAFDDAAKANIDIAKRCKEMLAVVKS